MASTTTTPSSSMRYERVAQLNNLGVDWFEQGDFVQSFQLFHQALSHSMAISSGGDRGGDAPSTSAAASAVNRSSRATGKVQQDRSSTTTTATTTSVSLSPPSPNSLLMNLKEGCSNSSEALVSSHFHSQGLRIELSTNSTQEQQHFSSSFLEDPIVEATICSCTVIFNLALLHHVKALHIRRPQQQQQPPQDAATGNKAQPAAFTVRAVALYRKCCELLFNGNTTATSTTMMNDDDQHANGKHPMIDMLCMAVLTNLSHLHYEEMDFEQSQYCQRQLVQYIHSMGPLLFRYPRNAEGVVEYMEQQRTNYLVNLLVLRAPCVAQAA